ncbi:unnamed protein product [Rotaria magnacalcarata]|uniref:VWFC domain-containing protein n=1 Tax=Rotaria magnacalcarata TaxID=392030 RepID=A0A8S2P7I5_9BILA|nr:unnamed protein product [Rotaria magnacalcarata]CAF4697476.1 unnamed protein product [Rotaria magnacalcarata]
MFRFFQYHFLLLQCFSIIRGDILEFQLRADEIGCVSDDGRLIPVSDKEYISPTNACDLCQCESDQSFVCDSRCDVISQSSDCPESERIENNDPLCPCLICPDQIALILSLPKSQLHLLLQLQPPQLALLKQLRSQLLREPPPQQLLQLLQQPQQLLQRLLRQPPPSPPPPPQQQQLQLLQPPPQQLLQLLQPPPQQLRQLQHSKRRRPRQPPQQQEKKQLHVLLQER